jgi:collagen type III alpha
VRSFALALLLALFACGGAQGYTAFLNLDGGGADDGGPGDGGEDADGGVAEDAGGGGGGDDAGSGGCGLSSCPPCKAGTASCSAAGMCQCCIGPFCLP